MDLIVQPVGMELVKKEEEAADEDYLHNLGEY